MFYRIYDASKFHWDEYRVYCWRWVGKFATHEAKEIYRYTVADLKILPTENMRKTLQTLLSMEPEAVDSGHSSCRYGMVSYGMQTVEQLFLVITTAVF